MEKILKKNKLSAYEAISEAQKIAFGPFIFQAVRTMRELGMLASLEQNNNAGVSAATIARELSLSVYGVETLLESGLSCGVVEETDGGLYQLSKVGYYLLHDEMTRVNMDYNHDVCYQGMYYLDEAIREGKPKGLKVFGEQWETLYQALPHLPEQVKKSWYAFDHFYSDSAYPAVLPILFERHPETLLDIGTNIGKFAILAAQYNADVTITMVDLPDQLQNAIRNVAAAGLGDRVHAIGMDLLDNANRFPAAIDAYWLSQFLSCFGKREIVSILQRVADVMAILPESIFTKTAGIDSSTRPQPTHSSIRRSTSRRWPVVIQKCITQKSCWSVLPGQVCCWSVWWMDWAAVIPCLSVARMAFDARR
jgi:hypothetical protein